MKKLLILFGLLCLAGCGAPKEAPKEEAKEAPVVEETAMEMDKLQELFSTMNPEYTVSDLETFLTNNPDIFYSKEEYNTGSGGTETKYQLGFTEEDTKQSHKKSSGDYLTVKFEDEGGSIMNAEYVPSGKPMALYYQKGTYYSFSDQNAEDYSGFYLNRPLDKSGIVVKYTNGNEVETTYFAYPDAESVLKAQAE